MDNSYLKISRASDIKDIKERIIYRFFEILPGFLSWGVLFLAVILSWLRPLWVAVFIVIYSIFWLLRTIYFSLHLWTSYKKMAANEKIDWLEKLNSLPAADYSLPTIKSWKDIYHLVVIPMYQESLEIIRGTFSCLEKNNYPKEKIIVVLGCEERTKEFVYDAVKQIEKEFQSIFFKFIITWHPDNLAGEIAGKGANESWAVKEAKKTIIDNLGVPYENIIFSSFDVDTWVPSKYFSCLTYRYLTSEKPTRSSFQPVPLFINNIWQAPIISQVFSFSSTFWHTINQERQENLVTFSSHSMSFKALVDVGFKQTNVVSDDSRIFWQCFFRYNGDYEVLPLYYPVSMDANVARSFWRTLKNIYKQQRRWAYGVAEIPYFLFGILKNKKVKFSKKIFFGFELIESHFSWAVSSILIFLLGWLPLVLGGQQFSQSLFSYSLPKIISRFMTFSMVGLILSIYLSFLLLPPKPPKYGPLKYLVFIFGWILFPMMMIFFTSLPSLDAQTRLMFGKYMGFWPTEKVRK